jgi:hypothetical protein
MADLTPEQQAISDQLEALKDAAERAGIAVDKFGKNTLKNIDASFKNLDKQVKKSGGSYKDAIGSLDSLREAIDEMDESAVKSGKQKEKLGQLEEIATKARNQILMEGAVQLVGTLIKGYTGYYINQAKVFSSGLLGGSSAFKLSTDLQVAAYDDLNKTVGSATTIVGETAVAMGALAYATAPATAGLSLVAAAAVAGGAALVRWVTETYTDTQKFKIQKLNDELELTSKSFNSVANAGATFAGGIQAFRDANLEAQVTQEVFAATVAANAQNLAATGLGVTGATEKLASTMGKLTTMTGKSGVTFRDQLQNLGFSIEEHGNLVADVMGMVKRAGKALVPDEMAKLTLQYAKDLRIIQEITGEDARKKIQESRQITEAYGFQTRFLDATKGNAEALEAYTVEQGKWPVAAQRAVAQAMDIGAVIDPDLIQMGYKELGESIAEDIKRGVVDLPKFTDQVRQNVMAFSTVDKERMLGLSRANAVTQEHNGMMSIAAEKQKFKYAYMVGNFDELNGKVDQAANNQGELNKGITDANTQLMKMKTALSNDLIPALKQAAADIPQLFKDARDKMIKAGLIVGVKLSPEELAKNPMVQPLPNETNESWEKRATDLKSSQDLLNKVGKKDGGIAEGPTSGYEETLHGTEAVVPLPNNRSIPVTLDSGVLVAAVQQQSSILADILRAMKDNNNLTSGILTNTY